jgi:hypothetical protein
MKIHLFYYPPRNRAESTKTDNTGPATEGFSSFERWQVPVFAEAELYKKHIVHGRDDSEDESRPEKDFSGDVK